MSLLFLVLDIPLNSHVVVVVVTIWEGVGCKEWVSGRSGASST